MGEPVRRRASSHPPIRSKQEKLARFASKSDWLRPAQSRRRRTDAFSPNCCRATALPGAASLCRDRADLRNPRLHRLGDRRQPDGFGPDARTWRAARGRSGTCRRGRGARPLIVADRHVLSIGPQDAGVELVRGFSMAGSRARRLNCPAPVVHPAPSIIAFTTASGAGYGLLFLLGLAAPAGLIPATRGFGAGGARRWRSG